jgi:hypothetical protein
MKSLLTTLAVAALALLGSAPQADARPHRRHAESSYIYVSGYRPCGTPIYTERYLVGYDRWGQPIFQYRRVSAPRHHYRPEPCRPRYYSTPVCPPPPVYYRERSRGNGLVIHGSIRL